MKRWGVQLALGISVGMVWGCRTAEVPPPAPAATPAQAAAPAPAPAGCVRGEPKPLLQALAGRPAPNFVRTAALEARETYAPGDSPAVEIRHFGCAHFGLEFAFTLTAAPDRDPGWQRAADLLAALPAAEDMKPTVEGIAKLLRRQAGALTPERLDKSEMESVTVKAMKGSAATRLIITYEFVL